MKYSASFIVIHNEGWRRRTLADAPPRPNNIHLSLSFSMISPHNSLLGSLDYLSFTISIPIINPAPLASPTTLLLFAILCSYFNKYAPTTSALTSSFSRSMALMTSMAALHWMFPPPVVLKKK